MVFNPLNRNRMDWISGIKGILFDMDGVLVDSEEFISSSAVAVFRELGQKVLPEDFLPYVGTGENHYLGGVAEKYGLEIDIPRSKARLYELYSEQIKGRLKPLPGVFAFIHSCRELELKLAVATSADDIKMQASLREIGLDPAGFDTLVRGEDVRHKKPAPDIYLMAAKGLGLKPAECLVIEDAPSGIRAGKSAGCRVLALTTSFPEQELKEADLVIPDLEHATKALWS